MRRRVHAALKSLIADGRILPGERLLRKARGRGYLVTGAARVDTLRARRRGFKR